VTGHNSLDTVAQSCIMVFARIDVHVHTMMSANMTRFYAKLFFEGVGHVHILCRLEGGSLEVDSDLLKTRDEVAIIS
jgi:hypothetical protein